MGEPYSQLIAEWNAAERVIKQAELLGPGTVVPAIVELRYAGRSLIDSLDSEDDDLRSQSLRDAVQSCKRARRDAVQAILLTLTEFAAQLDRSGYGEADEAVHQFIVTIQNLHGHAIASFDHRDATNINQEQIEARLPELISLYGHLLLVQRKPKNSVRLVEASRYAIIAAVAALIGTALSAFISFLLRM